MAYEYEVLTAAVRESNSPDRARGDYDLAEIRIMGGIAYAQINCDDRQGCEAAHVRAGMEYLDDLPERVDEAVAYLKEDLERGEDVRGIIEELLNFKRMSAEVDRELFAAMLRKDFDETFGEHWD